MLPSSIPGDDGDDDEDPDDTREDLHHHHQGASSNNSSNDLCEALLFSCANNNPKPRNLHHDPSSFMGIPSNSWEWGSSIRESMVNKGLLEGDNESVEEDHYDNITNTNTLNKKINPLGVSAFRMKKMKAGRRKVREPRFCFKTLSDVDVLDDGYKWRKYGQKVVKNTQHPRSYYRCTQDNCRVKKRVERLAEDPRMVITTYEGRHVHSPSHDNLDEDSNSSQPLLNKFFW
uniref:WRKY transcription factor n=1 Tax=Fagopyrum tataricum TaxID=62330 RepID=A0A4P9Q268_FAGTA|nr:WRKY transcription factor [Fagopyrum tataricum]